LAVGVAAAPPSPIVVAGRIGPARHRAPVRLGHIRATQDDRDDRANLSAHGTIAGRPSFAAAMTSMQSRFTASAAWAVIAGTGLADCVWARCAGVRFVHAGLYLGGILLLLAFAAALRLRRAAPGFARIAQGMALFLAFLLVSETLSFLCATSGMPLQDERLAAFDRSLHFDWTIWAAQVSAHPLLAAVLELAYYSYVPQFGAAIAYYAVIGRSERVVELLWLLIFALGPTMLLFALFPAAGPWVHDAVAAKAASFPVTGFAGLRSGAMRVVDLLQTEGIVVFPSFHAFYVVVLCYVHRGQPRLFGAALAINAVMLLSLPVPGGHYLADVIAGLAVAALSIAAWTAPAWAASPLVKAYGGPALLTGASMPTPSARSPSSRPDPWRRRR
jgi:hypothetical protein